MINFQSNNIRTNFVPDSSKNSGEMGFDTLPNESMNQIFSYMGRSDLARCQQVNARWNAIANDERLWKSIENPKCAFGVKQYLDYFGVDAGKEIPLPKDIEQILNSPCSFSNDGKKVEETQMLLFIPEEINGKPYDVETFVKIMQTKFPELPPYLDDLNLSSLKLGLGRARWILITKSPVPDSDVMSYQQQKDFISELGKNQYQIPRVLEVCTSALAEYARTKDFLYHKDLIQTRCREPFTSYHEKFAVGFINPTTFTSELVPSSRKMHLLGSSAVRNLTHETNKSHFYELFFESVNSIKEFNYSAMIGTGLAITAATVHYLASNN